jgi:hypothetical protein
MRAALVLSFIGSLSYALSTAFAIRLRDDLHVPTAAALAPTSAFSVGLAASDLSISVYLLAPVAAACVVLVARRSKLEAVAHGVLYTSCAVGLALVTREDEVSTGVLAACALLPLLYSLGEVARQRVSRPGHAHIRGDAKMWWLLQAVLACASGLTVLVVDRLGWPAFVAMAGVLALTKREFEAFAISRAAYEETVRALDRLRRVAASA